MWWSRILATPSWFPGAAAAEAKAEVPGTLVSGEVASANGAVHPEVGEHKYWLMVDYNEVDAYGAEGDYLLNRALLYRDRRDFVIQLGDMGKPKDIPTERAREYLKFTWMARIWTWLIAFAAILCRLFDQANWRRVMVEKDTLLAHMIPALTTQVEVAATKALVYILNKSEAAMSALNNLIQDTIGSSLEPVISVEAEKSYTTAEEESGRVDLLGYDKGGNQRVLGEAKFGAALSAGQGGGYLGQLAEGTSVLLFVVPDYRIDYLWEEVRRDVEDNSTQWKLGPTRVNGRIHSADVEGRDWHLMMVSWQLPGWPSYPAKNARDLRR